jgi:hypothetical protein
MAESQGQTGTTGTGEGLTGPDQTNPTRERQDELRQACDANLAAGRPPYSAVRIRTAGEVSWILRQHGWSGKEVEYKVKYELIPQGKFVHPVDLRGAWLSDINLSGMKLRRANLSGANLVRAKLNNTTLVDADLSHADLGFSDLTGANLSWVDLSESHLREVGLRNARLRFTTLCGTRFARCDLRGANLRNSRMDAMTLLGSVMFDSHTLLRDVTWNGAALTSIDWATVPKLGDEQAARPKRRRNKSSTKKADKLADARGVVRAYQQLSVALRSQGIFEPASRFAYRAQVLQRRVMLKQSRVIRWFGSLLLDLVSGYGYRPMRSLYAYIATISIFALLFWCVTNDVSLTFGWFSNIITWLGMSPPPPSSEHLQGYEAVVVSMTSFHGRGFFQPVQSPGDRVAILAAIEAFFGLLLEIVLIATFTQRFFAR